jgi:hypothetical protein
MTGREQAPTLVIVLQTVRLCRQVQGKPQISVSQLPPRRRDHLPALLLQFKQQR